MHTISRSSKLSCFFLIISFLVHPIFANQALSKDKIRVENVRFELVGEKINIYYDYFINNIFFVSVNTFVLNLYKYIPLGCPSALNLTV